MVRHIRQLGHRHRLSRVCSKTWKSCGSIDFHTHFIIIIIIIIDLLPQP
jgi:hypothetical protein